MTGFDDLNEAGKESSTANDEGADGAESDEEEPSGGGVSEPAFPFDESVQAQIYPRKSTHEAFEDFLDIDVKRHLRERDIRDETGRELHEAVLRVVMDHPEEVAAALESQRRE